MQEEYLWKINAQFMTQNILSDRRRSPAHDIRGGDDRKSLAASSARGTERARKRPKEHLGHE